MTTLPFRRRTLLAGLPLLLLAGCGYRPLYGKREENVPAQLASVRINPINDRIGQKLRNELIDLFHPNGRTSEALYELDVSLSLTESEIPVQRRDFSPRGQTELSARYDLRDVKGQVLTSGSLNSLISYQTSFDQYAHLVARRDAAERAAEQIARDLTRRLALYFERLGESPV